MDIRSVEKLAYHWGMSGAWTTFIAMLAKKAHRQNAPPPLFSRCDKKTLEHVL